MTESKTVDKDLKKMNGSQLQQEAMKLRKGIRYHRDQKRDDRCWLDDVMLYGLLPEKKNADFQLPPKKYFLEGCGRFWEERQNNPSNVDKSTKDVGAYIVKLMENNIYGKDYKKIAEAFAKYIVTIGKFHPADSFVKYEMRQLKK